MVFFLHSLKLLFYLVEKAKAKGFSLYTGRIGFIVETHDKEYFSGLTLGLLGNAIGTIACGYAIKFALPKLADTAETLCTGKLEQTFLQTLIRGVFCGEEGGHGHADSGPPGVRPRSADQV